MVNNRCQNGEEPQVDVLSYANGSDEGEEAATCPPVHASSVLHTRTSELTISFEGEVYVFPAVTPQKVPSIHSQLFYLIRTTPCLY